jgi:hypothetical protein
VSKVTTFKERAEAAQSVVTTLGLVLGGGWVLLKFDVLAEAARAEKELHKIEAETAQAEFDTFKQRREWEERQPAIEVSFGKATVERTASNHFTVLSTILLANRGVAPITLELEEAPFQMTEVEFTEHGPQPEASGHASVAGKSPLRAIALRPQTTSTLAFAVRVQREGLYLAEFRARLASSADVQWSTHDYVPVR